jgi:phosphoribosylformimino-5-aminoimidazole carboxamide ribotide isomerase
MFEAEGAEYLHVVDLDGAKAGSPQNLDSLRSIRQGISIPIEFGGGIRSLECAHEVLEAGANRVIVGTKLVQDAELARRMFDELGERVVAGVDARNGKVAVAGWTESSEVDAFEFVKHLQDLGAQRLIVTDIARDGSLTGPNIEFLTRILETITIPVIASGGVSALNDLQILANLKAPNLEGVIVGKAIYENRFSVREAVNLLEGR